MNRLPAKLIRAGFVQDECIFSLASLGVTGLAGRWFLGETTSSHRTKRGVATIRRLRRMDARLCVVACSMEDSEVMADPKRFGFSAVIAKPFKMEELGGLLTGLRAEK